MENIYDETKYIMKRYDIHTNKRLGQNFLFDENALDSIIESSNVSKQDMVIEIGPGIGNLTKGLVEKAGKVIAIELDERFIQILQDRFHLYENFEVIHQDILKVDLKELIEKNKYGEMKSVKIIANLPYYITTSIILKLLEGDAKLENITILIQKEVAERITAMPGDRKAGAITYFVYYYSDANMIQDVSHTSFIPSPEVESSIVRLDIRREPAIKVKDKELFFKLIKANFMQRRKTLNNILVNAGFVKDKEQTKGILEKIRSEEVIRGETLSIEEFAKLSDLIYDLK